ncbi:hypothetical protein [Devosia sp.]|uniref:hypothetical protein n=1 Tax=Devosia sp. TaxID=1871048 RepID=UPI001AC8D10C|nr:hypothetical protein [Devosia sp.]MBN9334216.1 hypothetical protein [Devosia sp.]
MINREWHETHRLGPKAKLDERIAWHIEHAQVCGCREMPESIKRELAARGIAAPKRPD